MDYDVSDMRQKVLTFAMKSTHQADYCIKLQKCVLRRRPAALRGRTTILIIYDVRGISRLFLGKLGGRGANRSRG